MVKKQFNTSFPVELENSLDAFIKQHPKYRNKTSFLYEAAFEKMLKEDPVLTLSIKNKNLKNQTMAQEIIAGLNFDLAIMDAEDPFLTQSILHRDIVGCYPMV